MDPDDSKSRLLDAAGRVFAAKGYAAATVREICEVAAANVAAVNYHFGDKEQLYRAAVKASHSLIAEVVPLPRWNDSVQPQRRLRDFIAMLTRRVFLKGDSRFPWQHQLLFREIVHPTVACGDIVADYVRPQFERLVAILRELLPKSVTEEELYRTAFSIVGQCLFYGMTQPVSSQLVPAATFAPDAIAAHVYEFTLRGLMGIRQQHRRHSLTAANVDVGELRTGAQPPLATERRQQQKS